MTFARADTPSPSPSIPPDSSFFNFSVKSGSDAQTYRMLDDQNRIRDSGNGGVLSLQDSIVSGHQRAQDMVDLLKNQELQNSFGNLNSRGKQILQENQGLQSPVTIVGGAVAFWVGRSIQLFKAEQIKLTSRVEARARSGEFTLESPIMNGKLSYTGDNGVSMNMNRKIEIINSRAEMIYSATDRTFTGQIVHPLTTHIDLSIGSSQIPQTTQTDGRATINYNLNF
jgi:hypothetical protein